MYLLEKLIKNKQLLLALVLINAIGFLFGVYYYQGQLAETNQLLWIFTLDSPLPVLLFAISCLYLYKGKRNDWLFFVSGVGLIKYGIWTDLVILLMLNEFFAISVPLYVFNILSHFVMILEGVFILQFVNPRKILVYSTMAFYLLNDYLDYFANLTLTFLPSSDLNSLLSIVSVSMSVLIPLFGGYWCYCLDFLRAFRR